MDPARKFYRAILETTASIVWSSKEQLHAELKCGYWIKTTTKDLNWSDYIDFTVHMFVEAFEIYYDVDAFKNEWIRFIFLFD